MKNRTSEYPYWPAAALLLTLLLTPESAWCWGRLGHREASELAESRLTPHALAAVRELLGPGVSLGAVSTWADEHRNQNSGAWHYVNVPITESLYDPKFCSVNGCVVSKIANFRQILLDPRANRSEKREALKYIVHLIEDLHQPMHVADNNDRGGNLMQVRFFNKGSNLHRLWDSQLIEYVPEDEQEWLRDITSLGTPQNLAEWSRGMPEDWATESLQAAKAAYRVPGTDRIMRSGTKLGDDYCRTAVPIIRTQLAKAGVRLAQVLNSIFR